MVRKKNGQFAKGQSGNPGGRRKADPEAAALIQAAVGAMLTPERVDAVVERLILQAERGDPKAREHLFTLVGIDLKQININQNNTGEVTVKIVYERVQPKAT